MGDAASDTATLVGGRGVWSATPWIYSSCRFLWLKDGGSGELIYGYGQSIHAKIQCRWELPIAGRLQLTYLDSPAYQFFRGYTPPAADRVRELGYTLTAGDVSGVEDLLGHPYRFGWTLELSGPPWPPGLRLPHKVPRVFFGHREPVGTAAGEPGAGPRGVPEPRGWCDGEGI